MAKKLTIPSRYGLVGEWLLNGDAKDSSGNGNDGTSSNVLWTATYRGYQSQCGVFNGTSSHVNCGTSVNPTTAVTLNVKFYASSSGGSAFQIIAGKGIATGVEQGFSIFRNGTTLYGRITTGGGTASTDVTTTIQQNRFHEATLTYDGTNMYLYLDGEQKATSAKTGTLNSGQRFSIGSQYNSSTTATSEYLSGNVQTVRIFNRALSATEIRSQYLEGLRALGGSTLAGLMDGCVALYDFKGDANDIVGGNNGTVTAATLTTDRFGTANSAYSFNGTSAHIALGTSGIPTGSSNRTMMAWINGTKANNTVIYNIGGFATDNNMGISIHLNGQLKAYVYGRADLLSGVDKAGLHLLGLTLSGTTLSVYVDGVFKASGTYSSVNITAENHDIGSLGGTYYSGVIESAIHFNRALSSNEMKAFYDLSSKDYILPFE